MRQEAAQKIQTEHRRERPRPTHPMRGQDPRLLQEIDGRDDEYRPDGPKETSFQLDVPLQLVHLADKPRNPPHVKQTRNERS